MNIFDRLRDDHSSVKGIMTRILDGEGATEEQLALFHRLRSELSAHSKAEQETFYAELEGEDDLDEMVENAKADHAMIDDLLVEIAALGVVDETWLAKMRTLQAAVETHITQEETQIFPAACDVLVEEEADEIGRLMEQAEDEYRMNP